MKNPLPLFLLAAALLVAGTSCLNVKTQSEVKVTEPIRVIVDVNLKVDKEIAKAFGEEDKAFGAKSNGQKPPKRFLEIKELLDAKKAGINNRGFLEARGELTDDEKILLAEDNAMRKKRYADIAEESGVSAETVGKRRAVKFAEMIPEGEGVWIQAADGTWKQR